MSVVLRGAVAAALVAAAVCVAAGCALDPKSQQPTAQPAHTAGPAQPPRDIEQIPADERVYAGTALEVLPAGSYTYLRVRDDSGEERWLVIVGGTVCVGDKLALDGFGRRRDFYSKRLDRRFDELVFAAIHE